jgi:hypothetical protein
LNFVQVRAGAIMLLCRFFFFNAENEVTDYEETVKTMNSVLIPVDFCGTGDNISEDLLIKKNIIQEVK